jgi:SAM-dependent methyltransferase
MQPCEKITAAELLKELRKYNKKVQDFLEIKNLSVLDIGCGFPVELCLFYHDLKFKYLVGVDELEEPDIVKNRLAQIKDGPVVVGDCKSLHDVYIRGGAITFDPETDPDDLGKSYMSEEEFKKAFTLHLGKSADKFFEEENEPEFDFIILSNLLHLLHPFYQQQIFKKAYKKLRLGGFMYVRVNHPDYKIERQHPFTEERFLIMLKFFGWNYTCKKLLDDGKGVQSMILLGHKDSVRNAFF